MGPSEAPINSINIWKERALARNSPAKVPIRDNKAGRAIAMPAAKTILAKIKNARFSQAPTRPRPIPAKIRPQHSTFFTPNLATSFPSNGETSMPMIPAARTHKISWWLRLKGALLR
uniref:Predicted protein n=1 Tax=Physcomitrium patens TaxID=3218 RepID=A9U717_PHYPA